MYHEMVLNRVGFRLERHVLSSGNDNNTEFRGDSFMKTNIWPWMFLILCFFGIIPEGRSDDSQIQMPSPVGKWKTIDDATGDVKSIVTIWIENGILLGRISELFRKPDEDPDPVCDKCTDDRKDQRIKGMIIIWDMKNNGNEWAGGYVLDPKNGKTYRSKLKLMENGKKLTLRGYIGISLIGRSQTWIRVE
jgi:hypothetical protein